MVGRVKSAIRVTLHGLSPPALNVLPSMQLLRHARSAFAVQLFSTPLLPHVPALVHAAHGVWPVADHVLLASHGTVDLHTVLLDVVHAASMPFGAHDDPCAQAEHGERPSLLQVAPPAQAVLHTVSVVRVQAFSTPLPQVDELEQALHGALPVAAFHVFPPSQSGAPLQTSLNMHVEGGEGGALEYKKYRHFSSFFSKMYQNDTRSSFIRTTHYLIEDLNTETARVPIHLLFHLFPHKLTSCVGEHCVATP